MLKKMNSSLGLPSSNFPLAEHLMKNNLSLYLPDAFLHEDLGNLENILLTIREPSTIALTVMYSISFAVGFVGNIMSIKVLTSKRNNRMTGVSATRSLLINLAVCDLMVVCVCMPTTLGYQIYKAWIYGDFMCRAAPFTQAVSVSASVLSITVISVNRYYNVHNPLNARSFFTWRKIFWTIFVVWLLSSGICLPLIFMNKLEVIDPTFGVPFCSEVWSQVRLKQAYNFLLFCSLYGLPVSFNLVICFLTWHKLWSTSSHFKECDSRSQSLPSSRLKIRKKIAKMVVALVILFALSWLPVYVVDIWLDFNTEDASRDDDTSSEWIMHFRPFAQWLGLTNSSLNPICYCFVGDLYRSAKEIKNKYRRTLVSLFNYSMSEGSTRSSLPKLLSYRESCQNSTKEFNFIESKEEKFKDCCSPSGICETSLSTCHPVPKPTAVTDEDNTRNNKEAT
ncbi:gastrin/cholecystokinin type B receptor-like [Scyliorhinus canicula]|uniref:gastrin/cholecystokinin type B receptor-like n=1 Tax=Scyliorhinus canicula TaxID=7830 RepID=UPI0018F579E4|nr:gastrin/cholecystokinin type B receptor-like [Scyliorhinus canicula]